MWHYDPFQYKAWENWFDKCLNGLNLQKFIFITSIILVVKSWVWLQML